MNDDFYIGYKREAPAGLGRFTRRVAIALAVALPLAAAVAAAVQRPFDGGTFEFGNVRTFEGVLRETPIPHMRLSKRVGEFAEGRALLLVSTGKHGVPAYVAPGFGKAVRFAGTLIYRGSTAMIEMAGADSFEVIADAAPAGAETTDFGEVTLDGELVDTKCYLGVMRPATGKVHRACAANCLRGGIQPGLLVRTAHDFDVAVMLAGVDGGALVVNPEWAARRIRASGRLIRLDELLALEVRAMTLVP